MTVVTSNRNAIDINMDDSLLHELTQQYAVRARQHSDAVARLGRFKELGPDFMKALYQAEECRASCPAAGDKLAQYIAARDRPAMGAAGAS
jgi:hypothetical protein